MKKNRQKGTAIITALLITAIVAAIATVMAVRQGINIRETSLVITADRAFLDAQGIVYWAEERLAKDLLKDQANKDLIETFPIVMPVTDEFYGAEVRGIIQDQQGLFNINCLSNANNINQFVRLLQLVVPDLTESAAIEIANNVRRWIRASNVDEIYLNKKPPYRAPHQRISHISELRLVTGITHQLYLALTPYITALPNNSNSINISSAPIPIIMSLSKNITPDQAKTLQECQREAKTSETPKTLLEACITELKIKPDANVNLTYESKYFLLRGYVKIGKQHLNLSTFFTRTSKKVKDKIETNVSAIWQSQE